MSAAETDRNVTFRALASAQANDVFAHPGGPYSRTPEKSVIDIWSIADFCHTYTIIL
jgi:hypothetical protein